MVIRVLLAIRPPALTRRLRSLLRGDDIAAIDLPARVPLWELLHREDADIVVIGRALIPEPVTEWIGSVRALPEHPEVVVLSEQEDARERASLLTAGCLAVLHVGVGERALAETLQALVRRRRQEALRVLRAERTTGRNSLSDFVTASPVMLQFMTLARRVVDSDSSLLIVGETGVGKERLARAIHEEGPRSGGPFLALNCAALPESLLESELFGHELGAFTGASRARRGYFELAHGGTLFLDEIGEMPLHLQVKLLRVLEDRRVQPLGGERAIQVDVRIMAATNRNLEHDVREKRFRPDLYYRLAVVTLGLPPLRERREDIPILLDHYLTQISASLGRPGRSFSTDAMGALVAYPWPGNVRELINVIERAVLLSSDREIGLSDLPRSITELGRSPDGRSMGDISFAGAQALFSPAILAQPMQAARREVNFAFEHAYLVGVLTESEGRIGAAARRSRINSRTLYDLMRRHALRKERFRRIGASAPDVTGERPRLGRPRAPRLRPQPRSRQ